MEHEFYRGLAQRVRDIAERVDPFTKRHLLELAERYAVIRHPAGACSENREAVADPQPSPSRGAGSRRVVMLLTDRSSAPRAVHRLIESGGIPSGGGL